MFRQEFTGYPQCFDFFFEPFQFGFFPTKDICGIFHELCFREPPSERL